MKEYYVSYSQAVKLKELGFDEPCEYCYNPNQKLLKVKTSALSPQVTNNRYLDEIADVMATAPRLDQAQAWLRETKGIMIEPFASIPDKMWAYRLYHTKGEKFGITLVISNKSVVVYGFNSYEAALSAGITECLKLLERK